MLPGVKGPRRIVTRETRCEIAKVKGSRFIATAGPFRDEDELASVIARLRDEYPEATHHCSAWRSGDRFRFHDDGEPSGTAGRPILQRLDGRGLDQTFVVVSRIFGGTKLGTGGLVRAYAAAAQAVLDIAPTVECVPTQRLRVTVPYELQGVLESILTAHAVARVESVFAEAVTQVLAVPLDQVDALVAELGERTAGRAVVVRDGQSGV